MKFELMWIIRCEPRSDSIQFHLNPVCAAFIDAYTSKNKILLGWIGNRAGLIGIQQIH